MVDAAPGNTLAQPAYDNGWGSASVPTVIVPSQKRKRNEDLYAEAVAVTAWAVPESFSLSGPAFHAKLHEELVSLVENVDELAAQQPCFGTFRLSTLHIEDWASKAASWLQGLELPSCNSGADLAFQEAYGRILNWRDRCGASPRLWEYGIWLKKVVRHA